MPEREVVDECPRCGFEPYWDGYQLCCDNCGLVIGTRDTVTKTDKTLIVHNQKMHAVVRDVMQVCIEALQTHASQKGASDELRQLYSECREQAEESDSIAAGVGHDEQWLHDILKSFEENKNAS